MNTKKCTILYIEDSPEDIYLITFFCKKKYAEKVELIVFNEGSSFLDFSQKQNPDDLKTSHIILLDIQLPYHDGFQILELLKTKNNPLNQIPVVMYSSSAREVDREKSVSLGAIAHIEKPFGHEGVENLLDFLVSKAR